MNRAQGLLVRRRDLLALAAGVIALRPPVATAQQKTMPVIGVLGFAMPRGFSPSIVSFLHGLQDAGYREAQNVAIDPEIAPRSRLIPPSFAGECDRAIRADR